MSRLILGLFLFSFSTTSLADTGVEYIDAIFARVSLEVGVPEKLLRAICWSETKFNPEAYNDGDGKGMNHAFGVCQVLLDTASELGFKDSNCRRSFLDKIDEYSGVITKVSRKYKDCKLFGLYTNILYAAKYLKVKLVQYDNSWVSAIAAYNAGSVRMCKTGKVHRLKDGSVLGHCRRGHLLNESYVDSVLKTLEANP